METTIVESHEPIGVILGLQQLDGSPAGIEFA